MDCFNVYCDQLLIKQSITQSIGQIINPSLDTSPSSINTGVLAKQKAIFYFRVTMISDTRRAVIKCRRQTLTGSHTTGSFWIVTIRTTCARRLGVPWWPDGIPSPWVRSSLSPAISRIAWEAHKIIRLILQVHHHDLSVRCIITFFQNPVVFVKECHPARSALENRGVCPCSGNFYQRTWRISTTQRYFLARYRCFQKHCVLWEYVFSFELHGFFACDWGSVFILR